MKSVILNLYTIQIFAHIFTETLEPQKGIYPRHFGLVFSIETHLLIWLIEDIGLRFDC